MKNSISVKNAAKLMGATPAYVYAGIQQELLGFGKCLKINPESSRFTYWIGVKEFEESTGIKVPEDMKK